MNKRVISIDIARALCIILVVVGHYHPENSPQWYETINRIIYSFHMPLFMFLSGYVYMLTNNKTGNYKSFVWKKFQRLMIPYFVASIVIIGIKLLTERGMYVENPVGLSTFYEMFYTPVAAAFLWFAYTLFLIFLIIPFFNTYKKQLFLLFFALFIYFLPVNITNLFCLVQLKTNLLYFVLGCIVFQWKWLRNFAINYRKLNAVAVLTTFAGIYVVPTNNILVLSKIKTISLALLGILLIFTYIYIYIERERERGGVKLPKFLLILSAYSYTIYLFHTTFEGFAKAVLLKMPFATSESQLFFAGTAIVVVLAGIICPLILHYFIEKYSKIGSFLIGTKYKGKEN